MKKIFSTIISSPLKGRLCGLLFALLATTTLWAYDFESGNLYYNITDYSEHTVEVTYQSQDEYNYGNFAVIAIPETVNYDGTTYSVTSIGSSAFEYCSALTSITIPNSVQSIGREAFYGCSALTSINIPEGVKTIEYNTFSNCSKLTSVTIPNSVTTIEDAAFEVCSSLETITIGNSVTHIGYDVFERCSSLTSVIWNAKSCSSLVTDECCWYNDRYITPFREIADQITTFIIGEDVKSIPNNLCSGMSIDSIVIPNNVTQVGGAVFWGCSSLKSVTLSENISSLRSIQCTPSNSRGWYDGFFEGCYSLTTITIPKGIKRIDYETFNGCPLTSIIWNAQNCDDFAYESRHWYYGSDHINTPLRSTIKSITFGEDVQHIPAYLCFGMENLSSITIPNSVTSIGNHAFDGCSSLISVTIPESVTNIGVGATFQGCTALKNVYWNAINCIMERDAEGYYYPPFHSLNNIEEFIFGDNVTTIPACLCYKLSGLTSIIIPDSVTSIGNSTFEDCSSLTSLTIGNRVTNIGNYAFDGCTSLTSMTIPNSVTSIGNHAFDGCSSLSSVTIGNSVTSIGAEAFSDCSSLTKTNYTGDIAGWCDIKFDDYSANPISNSHNFYINNQEIKDLVIPNTVDSIHHYTFHNCDALTSVTIPNSVTSIGKVAFYNCSGLTSLTIPNTITSIGSSAFSGCSSLTSVTLTAPNVADFCKGSINNYLRKLDILCTRKLQINGSETKTIKIPEGVTELKEYAFYNCLDLNEVSLPYSLQTISENAFAGCTKLYDIYCYAMEPPTAYESSFANYNAFLHVPCDNQRVYLLDVVFGNFKYIECIEAETATTDTVVVDPSFNDAEFTWPSNSDADTYTLAISKDGEVFCTLTFNANGQLTGIAFAPSRNGQHHAPAATQAANGFTFTVTGLDEGSVYTYDLVIKDSGENTLQRYSGEFRTQSTNDRIVTVEYDALQGQVTGAGTYLLGDTATLTVIPNEGYLFVAWGDGNTDNPRTLVVTQDTTLTAVFEILTYNVTVTCDPIHGSVTGSGTYNHGDVATLTAIPNEGYQFVTWGDGNTDNPRTLVVTQDTTLTALFEALTYNVTVTCDPEHGIVSGGGVYQAGETATLTATPKDGYEFVRWSDDNTTNPRTLTVTKDLTLTAEFAVIEDNNLSLISVRDGTLSDWDDLPEEYLFETQCAEGSSWNALKSVKVYADSTYINLVVEWDTEIVTDLSSVPFQVYLNVDNDAPTGGFSDLWIKPNIDLLLEGNFYLDGFPCAYQPVVALYAGTPLANEWAWDLISIESVAANQLITKGVMEIQIDYGKLPVKLENTFTVGFSIQQSWTPVGVLPNAANDNTGNRVLAEKMLVRINNVNVSTPVENTELNSSNVQKIFRDGQVLILRDGKIYSVMGQEL